MKIITAFNDSIPALIEYVGFGKWRLRWNLQYISNDDESWCEYYTFQTVDSLSDFYTHCIIYEKYL